MKVKTTPDFINKPFNELTKEELQSMIRTIPFRITPEEMMNHYGVSGADYINKIKSVGMMTTNKDRSAYLKEKKKEETKDKYFEYYEPIDLMAMRLLRGYNTLRFSKISRIHQNDVRKYERSKYPIPNWVGERYVEVLGIKKNELDRLRMLVKGEINDFEVDREIPNTVKEMVWKRDKGKCTTCGSRRKIHYHHIKHFSKGGLHQEDNLKLLCASCHAEEHKTDPSYYLLKRMAEV